MQFSEMLRLSSCASEDMMEIISSPLPSKVQMFSCYNIFASEKWQPATSRDISLPKLLEWEGNGLTLSSKGFVPVEKSVSHPPVRSVRFVQVEPRVRVTKQIESAMGKDGFVHCKFFQE